MSKKTMYLLGILLTILIGTYFYWKLCCNDCCNTDTSKPGDTKENVLNNELDTNTKTAISHAFSLKDTQGNFAFKANDNFNFNTSGYTILDPISVAIHGGVDKLKNYLETNKNKMIDVTGYYTSGEQNNSAYPNLGLARANAVKNFFVSKGIYSGQINTSGKLTDGLISNGSIYKGPLTYGFTTGTEDSAKADAQALKELRNTINANPLVLHFKTGQASINLSAEQRQKIADISRYLDKVPNSNVAIIGHTDNTGSRETNINLGQGRADFAKGYFVRNGISEAKIETSSQGPDQPIATNATEEGKAKNRRTVVSIK